MVTNHWARFCEPGPWGFVEVEEKSSAVGESSGSAGALARPLHWPAINSVDEAGTLTPRPAVCRRFEGAFPRPSRWPAVNSTDEAGTLTLRQAVLGRP